MKLQGKVAIITGASSGIGRASALELARHGVTLALAARRAGELEKVAVECRALGIRCEVIPTDVSDAGACKQLVEETEGRLGALHILVNNAGFAIFDTIAESAVDDLRAMMNTNYFGAVHCTKAALPGMIAQGEGAIVNVASIAGIMGFSAMGGYCATKFALIGMTEALRDEVMGKGIQVSLVCPATTQTEFFVTAERGKMPAAERLILAIPPERVARAIRRVLVSGTYRTIVPSTAALFMKYKELSPRGAHLLMRTASSLFGRKKP